MRIKTCLALAGVLAVGAASATTEKALELNEIAAQAEIAVVAKVTGSRTVQTDDGVVTISTLEVQKELWGAAPGKVIELTTLGGRMQSTTKFPVSRSFPGSPQLFKNSRGMFMLDVDSLTGKVTIVGFNQGLMPVVSTPQGDAVALPGRKPMQLEAAMATIKNARLSPPSESLAR